MAIPSIPIRTRSVREGWARVEPYLFAVLLSLVLGVVRSWLDGPLEDRTRFLMFLPGVVLVSWLGGTGPGVINLLGGLLAGAVVVPPSGERFVARPGDLLSASLYLLAGAVCVGIVQTQKRTQSQVEALNAELEDRVKQRTIDLETALRDMQKFTYAVAHNMRSPLRAIAGYSRIIQEESVWELSKVGGGLLPRLELAAKRMSQLIDDLLAYARLCTREISTERVDLSILARAEVERALKAHNCPPAEVAIQPDLTALADKRLIEEAIGAIVDNAVKFRDPDRALFLETRGIPSAEERIVAITDNGIGFEMTYSQKVFEPFERLHNDEDYPGTGIGLAIAARILEKNHGRIWLDSKPDEGTTVFLALPLNRGPVTGC